MSQIKKKFIEDNAVDQDKVRLDNNSELRARNAANSADINILKVNASDVIEFSSVPQVTSDASSGNDLVRKSQVDALLEGLKPKEAVRVATTAAGTLASDFENGDTVDGIVLATGDRILIKDQASASENGIYTVNASGAPTRAADFDETSPINEIEGAHTAVQEGTNNAGKSFVQQGSVTTVGTDDITFVFFNALNNLSGGDGIDITSDVISVDHDGEGLTIATNQLALELDGGTLSKSASGVKVADVGIDTAQLADDSVTAAKLNANTAGLGLTQAGSGELDVNVDDSTIEINTDTVRVKAGGIGENELNNADGAVDAQSFVLPTGYTASAGTVAAADTIDAAIRKLDGNVQAIDTPINNKESFTLIAGDITNQYIDLANVAFAGSIDFQPDGAPTQVEGVDYTVNLTGGAGGNTRITFAGDLASGGASALVATDVVRVKYQY